MIPTIEADDAWCPPALMAACGAIVRLRAASER
jgi:hypothetical protein